MRSTYSHTSGFAIVSLQIYGGHIFILILKVKQWDALAILSLDCQLTFTPRRVSWYSYKDYILCGMHISIVLATLVSLIINMKSLWPTLYCPVLVLHILTLQHIRNIKDVSTWFRNLVWNNHLDFTALPLYKCLVHLLRGVTQQSLMSWKINHKF